MDSSIDNKIVKLYQSLLNDDVATLSELFKEVSKYVNEHKNLSDLADNYCLCKTLGLFLQKRKLKSPEAHLKWVIRTVYLNLHFYYTSESEKEKNECLWIAITTLKTNFKYILPILITTSRSIDRLEIINVIAPVTLDSLYSVDPNESQKQQLLDNYRSLVYFAVEQTKISNVLAYADEWLSSKINTILQNRQDYENQGKSTIVNGYNRLRLLYDWVEVYCNDCKSQELKLSVLNSTFQISHAQYFDNMFLAGESDSNATIKFSVENDTIKVWIKGLNEDLIAPYFEYDLSNYRIISEFGIISIKRNMFGRQCKSFPLEAKNCLLIVDNGKLSAIEIEGLSSKGTLYNFHISGYELDN